MIDHAILKINPKAEFSINGSLDNVDEAKIVWDKGTTPISKEEIKKVLPQVQFEVELDWLREQRNRLLRETDFYALPDVTMSDEIKTYRQKLRDITKGLTTVDEIKAVTMPTKP